jgi:RHS repeat-associated protein
LETDGSNVTKVVYTLEPAGFGNLVSQRRAGSTFYLFDALGSTRKLIDFSGTVTDSYDYRAYGETFASSGSTVNVFRWVGELGYYFDIDRLAHYLRARPYNPAIARFLIQDPLGFRASKWNLYTYVEQCPICYFDPSGLKNWGVIVIITTQRLPKEALDEIKRIFADCIKEHCPAGGRIDFFNHALPTNRYDEEKLGFLPKDPRADWLFFDVFVEPGKTPRYAPGITGEHKVTYNDDVIRNSARDLKVPYWKALATVLAHEIGLHAIGDVDLFHFHRSGFVDAEVGKVGGKFSPEACKLILRKFGFK